eukprot:jgi/Mesen1/5691/ME000288S04903
MVRGPKKVGKKKKSKNSGAGSSAQGVRGGGDVEMGGAEGGAPAAPAQRPKVWQPGVDNVAVGEELQFDPTAYSCLHAFRLPWPCLRDALGPARAQFPHTLYLLAGTQADLSQSNMVGVLKLSNLTRMKTPKSAEDGEDDDDDDSESDSDSEDGGDDSMTDGGAAAAAARSASHGAARKPSMQVADGLVQWELLPPQCPYQDHIYCCTREANEFLSAFFGHRMTLAGVSPFAVAAFVVTERVLSLLVAQWSPTEADVFASASVDHKIIIWDARSRQQPALTLKAHDCDVNVISWNSIWDLSLERDEEEEAQYEAEQAAPQAQAPQDLPPQLLFVHQGQTSMKEVHWHPQIQGMLITTALDGFNVFRPSNL